MAQYQNFFTQVQVRSDFYPGIPIQPGTWIRSSESRYSYWLGKIGDAQVGPVYLGFTGIASIICGIVAIEIIGLNMLASVDWSRIELSRNAGGRLDPRLSRHRHGPAPTSASL